MESNYLESENYGNSISKVDDLKERSPTKLNLGSGNDFHKGWLNVDLGEEDVYGNKIKCPVDFYWDMNVYPYPFAKDNQFKEILMRGTLGQVQDIFKFVKELKRITCKGAIIRIEVPHFAHADSYQEWRTNKFGLNCRTVKDLFRKYNIALISKRLNYHNGFLKWLNPIVNLNELYSDVS